ncbi:hypothetical protein K469DRAFT_580293, partial [Zopfia rhizophila CBS 207.26]
NTQHLRQYSWSCGTLNGVKAVFQPSDNLSICYFCGKQFPPHYDSQSKHLETEHKFSECNKKKKFFRADNFRQHIAHGHNGILGSWMKELVDAAKTEKGSI